MPCGSREGNSSRRRQARFQDGVAATVSGDGGSSKCRDLKQLSWGAAVSHARNRSRITLLKTTELTVPQCFDGAGGCP